jgi:hypothetical protein
MQQKLLLTRAAKKQGEQKKRLAGYIRPQYVAEPQNVEGRKNKDTHEWNIYEIIGKPAHHCFVMLSDS